MRISEDLHRRLKLHAVEAGSSVREVAAEAIEKYLKRRGA